MSMESFRSARDVDPMLDFDPIAHFDTDTWIRSEVTRVWNEATGGGRPLGEGRMSDLGQDHFIGLVLSLESAVSIPILAQMHRFTGTTVDDFIQFVDDLVGSSRSTDGQS